MLRRRGQRRGLAPGVGEEAQRPARRDRGIELAQRSGRRVARIGEHLLAGGLLRRVETAEVVVAEVDLAAHLDQVRHALALQVMRDLLDRHDVGGDVLAFRAVAAGCGDRETAGLVSQRDREAVDLRLGREGERGLGRERQEAAHALDEVADVLVGEGVAERQHRRAVAHLAEALGGRRPDAAGRAVGAHEMGKARLDGAVALDERIVGGVRDLGRVATMVEGVVAGDLDREAGELGRSLGLGQIGNGRRRGAHGRQGRLRGEWRRRRDTIRNPRPDKASARRGGPQARIAQSATPTRPEAATPAAKAGSGLAAAGAACRG